MKKIAIIYDTVLENGGGINTSFSNFFEMFKKDYYIEIVSLFGFENNNIFNCNTLSLSKFKKMDFPFLFKYLKDKKYKECIRILSEILRYFCYIPLLRLKLNKILKEYDFIIVTSPSAGIFMPKNRKFHLDFQSKYDYFFSGSIFAKLQICFCRKPNSVSFKTKCDVNKFNLEKKKLNIQSFCIYNCVMQTSIFNLEPVLHKVCFVGRLEKEKNLKGLIEISKALLQIEPKFVIDIYGEGSEKRELIEMIKNNGMEKSINVMGFTHNKNIYKDYSVHWVTSNVEGFGIVIIEAKQCGTTTISTKWGDGVYELINQGVDGFVCDNYDDFVKRTIEVCSINSQISLRYNALESSKKFSEEKVYSQWKHVIESIK